jgi:hypothetical protein
MLRSSAHIASSKGMVKVPNLVGLTRTQARAAILASGLKIQDENYTNTYDNVLHEQTLSQYPSHNTLVDYETSVSFNYYNYIQYTPTTTSPTSTGGGSTTTYAYFAFCSGANLSTSGTSAVQSGQDVTSTCLTLKSQYGNPAGWNCGSSSNTSPTINCATYTPTPTPTPTPTTTSTTSSTPTTSFTATNFCSESYVTSNQFNDYTPGQFGCTYGAKVTNWYDECGNLVDTLFISCLSAPPTTTSTTTSTTTTSTCPSSPTGLSEGVCWGCGYYWDGGYCRATAPTTTTTTCVPTSGAYRPNFFDCPSFFEYYNDCTGASLGCVPPTPTTPTTTTPTTTTSTTNTCPPSPSGLTQGECWSCGYYWNGGSCVSVTPTTTTTSATCTPVSGAIRTTSSCASSLEYYDTCTGAAISCYEAPPTTSTTTTTTTTTSSTPAFNFVSAFGFTPFGFTPFSFTPYTNFSFTPFSFVPFGFTPVAAFSFIPYGNFSFTPVSAFNFVSFSFTPVAPFSFTPFSFTPTSRGPL